MARLHYPSAGSVSPLVSHIILSHYSPPEIACFQSLADLFRMVASTDSKKFKSVFLLV